MGTAANVVLVQKDGSVLSTYHSMSGQVEDMGVWLEENLTTEEDVRQYIEKGHRVSYNDEDSDSTEYPERYSDLQAWRDEGEIGCMTYMFHLDTWFIELSCILCDYEED